MTNPTEIIVCVNTRVSGKPACGDRGSEKLADRLEEEIARRGLKLGVKRLLCLGQCEKGPNMRIAPGGRFFHHVTEAGLGEVIGELENLAPSGAENPTGAAGSGEVWSEALEWAWNPETKKGGEPKE